MNISGNVKKNYILETDPILILRAKILVIVCKS